MSSLSIPHLQTLENDHFLEQTNQIFWSSLLDRIHEDLGGPVDSILDLGCHDGGLLVRLAGRFHPKNLIGIEPANASRERAIFRLRTLATSVTVVPPERWDEIATASINLITCHEVLHLVEDLSLVFYQISRTLRANGTAFVVVGCHTENPLWPRWSSQLQTAGQTIFDRSPFDIMRAGIDAGLSGALRPLRRDGWVIYDPDHATFTYSSAQELLDHQYRHKLLFRFMKQP